MDGVRKLYVAVTDNSWFEFLAALRPDEVNFWQPGGTATFRALSPGELFLFKLHAPDNYIAGGGFFVKHSLVPLSLAWEAFGEKNGTSDFAALRQKILQYRGQDARFEPDPVIGVDIEQAVLSKIEVNEKKYPVELAKDNATKYNKR